MEKLVYIKRKESLQSQAIDFLLVKKKKKPSSFDITRFATIKNKQKTYKATENLQMQQNSI